ncbi:flagellar basal-body rod protein FlgF [Quadrisphaera oryzae]|uniref:flagellar basal-body rod protein FlgF n=1 Tax=Quadrisphaera TaxID=317661 RepID=UPI0016475864|nr:flagellar basal-body rod protein FlgF [Quadrisphaera sp. RL12-1S]
MLRSLYTGISGMRSMQTMMDVTGNNIANVNTTGYKASNTIFEDTLSQSLGNAAAAQGAKGGQNPAQVGLGVRVSGITTNFTQGATQTTGRNSDMLIDGDGFFVLNNNGAMQYTRNGAFNVDGSGTLVSLAGAKVQGWMASPAGVTNSSGTPGNISIPTTQTIPAYATHSATFSGRLDNTVNVVADATATSGYSAVGSTQNFNYNLIDKNGVSIPVTVDIAPTKVTGPSTTGGNTGLVTEWTMTLSQTVPGSTTVTQLAKLKFNGSGAMTDGGSPTYVPAAGATPASGAQVDATNEKVKVYDMKGADGSAFTDPVTFDLSKITVANRADVSISDVTVSAQDGYGAGSLTSWKVGPDGAIVGSFDNGRSQELGRIAVATFDNPAGLDKQGGSTYQATSNSGLPNVGVAGDGAHGSLVSGALEMSNVDLAQEFTNLIVSQRGFQANSRVITTSDSMLEELVNLKR